MPPFILPCPECKSLNTRVQVDETILSDGDCSIHVELECLDCKKESPFPEDSDWRDYV